MRRSRRTGKRRKIEEEDINPMSYVSNLSDVMLILAVGIMLALILHWKVDLQVDADTQVETADEGSDVAISFSEDELEGSIDVPENMERMGDVYYDPDTGTYYISMSNNDGN